MLQGAKRRLGILYSAPLLLQYSVLFQGVTRRYLPVGVRCRMLAEGSRLASTRSTRAWRWKRYMQQIDRVDRDDS